jgi:uncharacterized membrane protein YgdD (TMEM256/DUF423 family)
VTSDRLFGIIGAVSALVGVVGGAFGAHALRDRLTTDLLSVFETGIRYQMYHALGLLFVAWASTRWGSGWTIAAGWLFVVGTVIFSGSLYALSLSGVRAWGAVTPIGGLSFILGWACLVWALVVAR